MSYGGCPMCGSGWVTFSKVRGTHKCNACGVTYTPDEYQRWYDPRLPLNAHEQELAACSHTPQRIVVQRLLATLVSAEELRDAVIALKEKGTRDGLTVIRGWIPVEPSDGIIKRLDEALELFGT